MMLWKTRVSIETAQLIPCWFFSCSWFNAISLGDDLRNASNILLVSGEFELPADNRCCLFELSDCDAL